MSLKFSDEGVSVGDGALEANIKKVFDIAGVEDLATGTFSADVVEVNAVAAEGGKVKFTVTPMGEDGAMGSSRPTRFFFTVKMKERSVPNHSKPPRQVQRPFF